MTYTFAILEVSEYAFEEIVERLEKAGYQEQITYRPTNGTGPRRAVEVDLHGLALRQEPP